MKGRSESMKLKKTVTLLAVMCLAPGLVNAADSPDEQRQKIRKMRDTTLDDLYKLQPAARGAIANSAGYAVFNNMGTNILVLATARGAGLAVDSKSKHETFMKMVSVGGGLGIGVKDYRVIFVFETPQAMT